MSGETNLVREASVIGITALRPNPWNPNVQSEFIFERERASIREFGFVDPVTVRVVPGQEGYEIVDGEHRWRAAKAEGYAEIAVMNLGEIPDHVAKRLTVVLNETRGEPDSLKMSELIKSLLIEDESLLAVLPYTDQELKRFIDIASFDLSTLETSSDLVAGTSADMEIEAAEGSARLKMDVPVSGMGTVQRAITVARKLLGAATDSDALVAICSDYLERLSPEQLEQAVETSKKRVKRTKTIAAE